MKIRQGKPTTLLVPVANSPTTAAKTTMGVLFSKIHDMEVFIGFRSRRLFNILHWLTELVVVPLTYIYFPFFTHSRFDTEIFD